MAVSGIGSGSYGTADTTNRTVAGNAPAGSTLTMESFMQLLAVQMQNQDMTNPMSNAEMMNQLTQMATVQSMNTFTDLSTTQYAIAMMGKEVKVAYTGANGGLEYKTGVISGVDLNGQKVYLKDDKNTAGYGYGNIMQLGVVPEAGKDDDKKPEEEKPEDDKKPDGSDEAQKPEGPGESEKPEGSEKPDTGDGDSQKPGDGNPDNSKNAKAGVAAASATSVSDYVAQGYPVDKAEFLASRYVIPEDKQQALARQNTIPEDKKAVLEARESGSSYGSASSVKLTGGTGPGYRG